MAETTIADDAIKQELVKKVPGTNATLHGPYITFHFMDAPDETYVLMDLIHALAEIARGMEGKGAMLADVEEGE